MNHIIITGASRGLGRKLAIALASPENHLQLIARRSCTDTGKQVERKGGSYDDYAIDLTNLGQLPQFFDQLLDGVDRNNTGRLILVNNAGTLNPIGPLGKYDFGDYRTNLEINFMVPTLLTHLFIQKTAQWGIDKRVMFVSSGAARKPYRGWTHYCGTKAGVDMLMKTAAMEQDHADHPVLLAGFNPSRIETDMQVQIRSQDEEDFSEVDDFIAAKEDGRTGSAEEAAQKLAHVLLAQDYPHGEVVKAKELALPG